MDDNNLPIHEEVKVMCEIMRRTFGCGALAEFTAHVQQDSRPEPAEESRGLFFFLGYDK